MEIDVDWIGKIVKINLLPEANGYIPYFKGTLTRVEDPYLYICTEKGEVVIHKLMIGKLEVQENLGEKNGK